LAEDWFTAGWEELGGLSFELHSEVAEKEDGREKWGYPRRMGISYSSRRGKGKE